MFLVSAQNIDCGYSLEPPRRGGSNEYPQSMFWADIWNIMYTPVNPSFYYIKVWFKGVKIILACFRDGISLWWFIIEEEIQMRPEFRAVSEMLSM